MTAPDPMLTGAFSNAARGWPVFFLGQSKRPVNNCPACDDADPDHDPAACNCLCCHSFYAATLDPDRIRAMHTTIPGGLLAIATGAVSGLVVVDIDPRNGGALDPALMTPTYAVASGGGGWHLYYRHPGGRIPSRRLDGRPGVDIKADGGYVVAPPSIHPATGQPYRQAGDRPVNEMRPPLLASCRAAAGVAAAPDPRPTPTTHGGRISSPPALLAAHLAAVENAPPGRRRTTLYGAARGVARMVAANAISHAEAIDALTAVGHAVGQPERDARAAIVGGFRAEGVAI
ncbi:bifunctional DNA primase/polymerase [Cryptosporangium aurantiacum]|uniref:Bifunctional DNA primase/polymerase, N-terminal n=1 Tax=Cryptosporangium aurantiacum TaxID=134849 RepID=A0A1M7RJU8_9ACTN|nr:bifunctional DNA primase/polymerase [Cryptosporangium aurantiacum]SHN46439.1 Bifunctional DNA primase/polymerase, N-terminal [Cryptosporangium aurantiacum]